MPKEIVFKNIKYELQKGRGSSDYYSNDDGEFLMNNIRIMEELNCEVKLIGEQQDIDIQAIEELRLISGNVSNFIIDNRTKINELIKAIKQLDRNINKE